MNVLSAAGALVLGVVVPLSIVAAVGIPLVTIRRMRRQHPALSDEHEARAEMDRLCPHGWEATITVTSQPESQLARDGVQNNPVALEWREITGRPLGPGRVAVSRRIWARDVAEALWSMVEDRRTDALLETIEAKSPRSR